jgi:hypothetical protein
MVKPVVVIFTQTACVAAKLAVAAFAGVITTTGAVENNFFKIDIHSNY